MGENLLVMLRCAIRMGSLVLVAGVLLAEPAAVTFTTAGHFGGATTAVEAEGSYLYYNQGYDLLIYDRAARLERARLPMPGPPQELLATPTLLYCACGDAGLVVVDVTEKTAPRVLSSVRPGGFVDGLQVRETYAFIVASNSAVHVVDLSVPSGPRVVRTIMKDFYVEDAALDGSTLYVSDGIKGLFIFDVAIPESPRALAHVDNVRYNGKVVASNGVLYDSLQYGGLLVYDVSNPLAARELVLLSFSGRAGDLDLAGTTLYFCNRGSGLSIFDVSDPSHPVSIGSLSSVGAYSAASRGALLHVAGGFSGEITLDVSDPSRITIVSRRRTLGVPRTIHISGTQACVADYFNGFTVLDVSRPSAIALAGSLPIKDTTLAAAVSAPFAYVACGNGGTRVVDFTAGRPVRQVARDGWPSYAVALAGTSTLVVARGSAGIGVLNVKSPKTPRRLATLGLGGWIDRLAVKGSTVYAGNGSDIHVIDLSQPNRPALRRTLARVGADGFAIQNRYLYATGLGSLSVLNASQSLSPVLLGDATVSPPQYIHSLFASGTRLFLGARFSGVQAYDAVDRSNPVVIGELVTGGDLGLVHWHKPHLFVGDVRDGGLTLYNVTDTLEADAAISGP